MTVGEINDWQFGKLKYEDGWGWCAKEFEWSSSDKIGLCLALAVDDAAIPDSFRDFFNALREREQNLKAKALENPVLVTWFNERLVDDKEKPNDWLFTADTLSKSFGLLWVRVDDTDVSELQYVTGGPLFRVFVTNKLVVEDAYLD